jgi:hypothetical protein
MAKQPKQDEAIEEIKALEDRRYRAMLAGSQCSRRPKPSPPGGGGFFFDRLSWAADIAKLPQLLQRLRY